MRKLQDVIERVNEIVESRWSFRRDEADLMRNLEGMALLGQVVKRDLYFEVPLTMMDPERGVHVKMTPEQINEYLDTGDVLSHPLHVISNWIVGKFDLDRMTVRMFQTPFCSDERSPYDNYAVATQRIKEYYSMSPVEEQPYNEQLITISVNKLSDESKETWLRIKKAAEFFHDNGVVDDERIKVSRMKFFGDFLAHGKDDEWEETAPRELIKVPNQDQYEVVKLDQKTINAIEGNSFDSIYYSHEVELKKDRNYALNYLWSALEWAERKMGVKFDEVIRESVSNKWPVEWPSGEKSPDIVDKGVEEVPEAMERYLFRVGKVKGIPIVELECWENGHVYKIRNHDDEGPQYFKRFMDGRI